MSGYNQATGIFELTYTKAKYWHRKPVDPAIEVNPLTMEYYAEVLRRAGLDVLAVKGAFLRVRATPGRVWEALSGQPSSRKY